MGKDGTAKCIVIGWNESRVINFINGYWYLFLFTLRQKQNLSIFTVCIIAKVKVHNNY